jgi:hypothetical protein
MSLCLYVVTLHYHCLQTPSASDPDTEMAGLPSFSPTPYLPPDYVLHANVEHPDDHTDQPGTGPSTNVKRSDPSGSQDDRYALVQEGVQHKEEEEKDQRKQDDMEKRRRYIARREEEKSVRVSNDPELRHNDETVAPASRSLPLSLSGCWILQGVGLEQIHSAELLAPQRRAKGFTLGKLSRAERARKRSRNNFATPNVVAWSHATRCQGTLFQMRERRYRSAAVAAVTNYRCRYLSTYRARNFFQGQNPTIS